MSGGSSCKCDERKEPIVATGDRPARLWRVLDRKCNHSAFNGYHWTSSPYSSIQCLRCGAAWRTKAPYVDSLRDRADSELNITYGYAGHAQAMQERGREAFR